MKNDYTLLKIECYICKKIGHRAIECVNFHHKRGNLIQIYNRVMKRGKSTNSPMSSSLYKLKVQMNQKYAHNGLPSINNSRASPVGNQKKISEFRSRANKLDVTDSNKLSIFNSRNMQILQG